MTEHTALPLALKKRGNGYDLIDKDGKFIMALTSFWFPSARQIEVFENTTSLIVTACNSYRHMLEALRIIGLEGAGQTWAAGVANEAIRKAEEQVK